MSSHADRCRQQCLPCWLSRSNQSWKTPEKRGKLIGGDGQADRGDQSVLSGDPPYPGLARFTVIDPPQRHANDSPTPRSIQRDRSRSHAQEADTSRSRYATPHSGWVSTARPITEPCAA
jgi:hypothetical protein